MAKPIPAPNTVPWPPIIYVSAAAGALVLNLIYPLPWPQGWAQLVLAALGLCGLCAGIALEAASVLAFRHHRTTILPHKAATALITTGPFAKSRNPIYLGNTILLAGAGLLSGIAWFLPAAFGAAFLTQKLAIEREELHLAARFGAAWQDYATRTPRWLIFR
jgi:protein-S-isoprenylcysteine O-methyltransferase Ste14